MRTLVKLRHLQAKGRFRSVGVSSHGTSSSFGASRSLKCHKAFWMRIPDPFIQCYCHAMLMATRGHLIFEEEVSTRLPHEASRATVPSISSRSVSIRQQEWLSTLGTAGQRCSRVSLLASQKDHVHPECSSSHVHSRCAVSCPRGAHPTDKELLLFGPCCSTGFGSIISAPVLPG